MLKMPTSELKSIVGKLNKIKPSSFLEITEYWHIIAVDGFVTFTAYDGNNFLSITKECDGSLDTIVKADQLGKLISKTTVKEMTLNEKKDYLEVKGNGTYKAVSVNEQYPEYSNELPEELPEADVLSSKVFKSILSVNKTALPTGEYLESLPDIYYLDQKQAITTNGVMVCFNPVEGTENPSFITPEMLELICCIDDKELYFCELNDGENYYIVTDTIEIYGKSHMYSDEFPDTGIFKDLKPTEIAETSKSEIIGAIDRLVSFQSKYEENRVTLFVDGSTMQIFTENESSETIKLENTIELSYEVKLSGIYFRSILSSLASDAVKIGFGAESIITIEAEDGTKNILATVLED